MTPRPSKTPPLQGGDFVTPSKHSRRNLSTVRPQAAARMWIKRSRFIHSFVELSTEPVDKCRALWTTGGVAGWKRGCWLWINLWIRGVKSVDKPVDNSVENSGLWISRELSTICPQECGGYPQKCPQRRGRVSGLGKAYFAGYPHIHRPYYYYYSK